MGRGLSTHAVIPNQNFASTVGKNASDIALVIDAMDLLHTGRFDAFCIVSSDGDFTRLAARIREQGVDVYGFGEQKAPESFRKACKRFIYTEYLATADVIDIPVTTKDAPAGAASDAAEKQPPHAAVPYIRSAVGQLEGANSWYSLSAVGSRLATLTPDFDPRAYGCPKLVTVIEKSDAFDVRRDNQVVYIRPKEGLALNPPTMSL